MKKFINILIISLTFISIFNASSVFAVSASNLVWQNEQITGTVDGQSRTFTYHTEANNFWYYRSSVPGTQVNIIYELAIPKFTASQNGQTLSGTIFVYSQAANTGVITGPSDQASASVLLNTGTGTGTSPGTNTGTGTGTSTGTGTASAAPADLSELTRFFLKIVLVIAAAMVPVMIGDKLAGGISNMIGNKTKGMKDSAYKSSRFGSNQLAGRKTREGNALGRAMGRRSEGNALTRAVGETSFGKSMGWSTADRAGAREAAMKQFMPSAESMSKDQRNEYLSKYAKKDGTYQYKDPDTGKMVTADRMVFDKSKAAEFDKDYRAQAILHAQGEAGLLNDDVSGKLGYLNQMRAHQAAKGYGETIAQIKKAGGYDYLMDEHLEANAGAALGQFGSAMRDAATPEKLASWGSEAGDRLAETYSGIDESKTYNYTDANGVARTMSGVEAKERVRSAIGNNFTVGNVEKIFTAESTGGKAHKLFNGEAAYDSSGNPTNFMGILKQANPEAYARAIAIREIHKSEGAVAQPVFDDPTRRPPIT